MPAVPGQMRELPSEAPGIPSKLPRQKKPMKGRPMDLNGAQLKNIHEIMTIKKEQSFFFRRAGEKNPENSEKERIDQIGNSHIGLSRKRLFGIFLTL